MHHSEIATVNAVNQAKNQTGNQDRIRGLFLADQFDTS